MTVRKTLLDLQKMVHHSEKIAVLTCYEATLANHMDAADIDVLLVGDSLGMVIQGHSNPLPVTLKQMIYHLSCVVNGSHKAMIWVDMPFGTTQLSPENAYKNACAVMQAGAQMIKIEGGAWMAETIEYLVCRGIPVCAHVGLLPQNVHQLGGFRVQGRGKERYDQILVDAQVLESAGASVLLIEAVPLNLANELVEHSSIPTIGIGAGPAPHGQVLVVHDVLGLSQVPSPRFVKDFLKESGSIQKAFESYRVAVKTGQFPEPIHCY